MYFTGVYEYSMDDRGRIPLPPRFRRDLQDGVVLTQGTPDRCLRVYPSAKFDEMAALIMAQPSTTEVGRVGRRVFFSGSHPTELDGQGRVLVPPTMRRWANLDGDVVVTGSGDSMEIWNATEFGESRSSEEDVAARMWGSTSGEAS
jgi:MraZ protein